MEGSGSYPTRVAPRLAWLCLLGAIIVASAAPPGDTAVAAKLSCSTISPALITKYLVGVTVPESTGWDRGTLNCTYPELIQPKAGENLVLIGYLIHATAKNWQKFENDAAKSGHGVIHPPIGYDAVGYVIYELNASSASVIAVRDGHTIFSVLAIPEAGFGFLESFAKKMAPLVRS